MKSCSSDVAQIRQGFTIVELLIVVVIIAILAAITLVTFNGIQAKAHDSAVRSDFRAIANNLEMYKVDKGVYPHNPSGNSETCTQQDTTIRDALDTIKVKVTRGSYDLTTANTNLLYMVSNDGLKYALLAYAIGGPTYYISHTRTSPVVYEPDPNAVNTWYPKGSPCAISTRLGVSAPGVNNDFGYYYIYTGGAGGGFRIW